MRRLRRTREDGLTAVTVLFTFLALTSLVLVTAVYASNAVRPAGRQLHWARAGAAAEAGLADYEQRLLAEPAYWLEVDCANDALVGQDPAVVPHTCTWSADDVGWSPAEPGGDAAADPAFHYEITGAPAELDDDWATELTLTVSGRSGDVVRSLDVVFTRESTSDYALHQESDLVHPTAWAEGRRAVGADPALADGCGADGAPALAADRAADCANQAALVAGDRVEGPVLARDRLVVSDVTVADPAAEDPSVTGEYVTADPECDPEPAGADTWAGCVGRSAGGDLDSGEVERLLGGWAPQYRTWSGLPSTTASYADVPGCHYYGATRIVGEGERMRVWSPGTDAAKARGAVLAVALPDGTVPDCDTGTIDVPDGVAVHVWTTPEDLLGGSARWGSDSALDTQSGRIGGDAVRGYLPIGAHEATPDPSYVAEGDWLQGVVDPETTRTQKWSRHGNLYLEGYFSPGATGTAATTGVTFVAQESVIITGDVVRTGASSSDRCAEPEVECLLGIVAGRDVEVMNPWVATLQGHGTPGEAWWDLNFDLGAVALREPTSTPGSAYDQSRHGSGFAGWPHRYVDHQRGAVYPDTSGRTGVQIQAAIQALSGALLVQSHWQSVAGFEVVVTGSLAQRYVGALGALAVDDTAAGYAAHYPALVHDPALATASPPYLAPLEGRAWLVRSVGEGAAG